ncbi:MAG: hypothetical protein Q4F99_05130 [bacterium]|nr:hypothetical protein [bacterium]
MANNEDLYENPNDGKDELLKLFDEGDRSYFRRLADMFKGFKAPKGSLERKKAMVEFQRLGAPIAAILIVGLAILAMVVIKFTPNTTKVVASAKVEEVEEIEELEEPEEPEPPEDPPELEEPVDIEVDIEIEAPPTTAIEQSPQPVPIDAVMDTPSPVSINVRTSKETGLRGAKIGALKGIKSERYVVGFLRFLATQQNKETGLWGDPRKSLSDKGYGHTGATALALLCYLAHGEVPGASRTGEFDAVVRKAIEGLLNDLIRDKSQCTYKGDDKNCHSRCSDKVGLFKSRDPHNYSHLVAIYALAEAYAMTNIPDIKEAIEIALEPVFEGQTKEGGWYYNMWPKYPEGTDQIDSSFISWAVQALKAAKLAKVRIPNKNGSGDRVVESLKKATRAILALQDKKDGHFYYTDKDTRNHKGLTAPCALILQLLDMSDSAECNVALRYMNGWEPTFELNHTPKATSSSRVNPQQGASPQYYCYYLSQVRYNQGENSSDWKRWHTVQQALYGAAAILIPPEKSGYKDHNGKAQEICYWGVKPGSFNIGGRNCNDMDRLKDMPGTKKTRKDGKDVFVRGSYEIDDLLCTDFGNLSWATTGDEGCKRVISGCFTALQLTAYYRYSPLQKGALTKIEEEAVVEVENEGGLEIEGLDDL